MMIGLLTVVREEVESDRLTGGIMEFLKLLRMIVEKKNVGCVKSCLTQRLQTKGRIRRGAGKDS